MHTKYMFDTVFETDEDAHRNKDEPELAYTEQEYLAAMDQGRMMGMETGIRSAKEEVDNLASEAMLNLSHCLKQSQAQQEMVLHDLRAGSAQLAFAVANKLCAELMQRQPQAEIENLIFACVDQLIPPPQLRIFVHPDVLGILQERMGQVIETSGYSGQIGLAPDPTIEITDARIEWDNGGTSFSFEELTSRVSDVITYYCAEQYDRKILPELPADFFDVPEPEEEGLSAEELEDLEMAGQLPEPLPENEEDVAPHPEDMGDQNVDPSDAVADSEIETEVDAEDVSSQVINFADTDPLAGLPVGSVDDESDQEMEAQLDQEVAEPARALSGDD